MKPPENSEEERMGMGKEERVLIELCCSLSTRAHSSSSSASPFILHSLSHPSPSSIFAFPGSWSAEDWISGDRASFGETEVDSSLFPSLKSIGNDVAARVNMAFFRSFQRLLATSRLQSEVHRAIVEKKRIVFTGHSSGGAIAALATIWLLEQCFKFDNSSQVNPFCVTFGSPLVGDHVFHHALKRENWSHCFLHFVMTLDIVPRILLTPLSSFKEELQAILHFLCPRSLYFSLESIGNSQLVTFFYSTVLKSALSISSYRACLCMGCTNPSLGALTAFIKLSPYRPFGTYVFCTSNGRLVHVKNSDAILQLFFYCLQWDPAQTLSDFANKSLNEHLQYELKLKEYLNMENVVHLDCLKALQLSLNNGDGDKMQVVGTASEDLELSNEAMLCLHAAEEWEKQRQRNQVKIDANYHKIQEAMKFLDNYRATCEIRELSYYDTFKCQTDVEDFNANVKRLELAGLWDEIVEMLRRYELPDGFECQKEWVDLGTRYRHLVEPLDIANYYRHSKNEDTGSYLEKGRPRRYTYTQRWLEHAQRMTAGSSLESCFWAIVEELCVNSCNNKPFEEARERILELENKTLGWFTSGKLSKDVLLGNSTFVKWWKTLPKQHMLESCIARFIDAEENLPMI
ncbi:protein EDS1B-like [Phoenix dactylifera]|uniref:Protein EDS1B-like n=1 Tax=Phoenix dactylifera TaxID=42345 RepID=A0A8B7CH55_PHODC|nr:protein EDS1B-like [Phoenix dactylifera]